MDCWGGYDGGFAQSFGNVLDEICGTLEVCGGGCVFSLALLVLEVCFGEAAQLRIDCEFKLEFDGIDQRLDGCFDDVIPAEFQPNQDHIHCYADEIDDEQLQHGLSCARVVYCP